MAIKSQDDDADFKDMDGCNITDKKVVEIFGPIGLRR